MKKYADVSKVVYDPKGTDPFTFRWYDPDEVIAGKKMREHLKFALSYWHTIDAEGVDMFGSGTMDKSMGQTDPMAKFRAKADFAFELMEKLDIDYYCFHDVDIAPEGATLAESIANFRVMVDYLYELQKKTGKKCLWVTANNFGDKKFMAGAATSCCADVFAAAAAKVTDKKAMLEAMDNYRKTYPVIKEYRAIRKEKDRQKSYTAYEADFIINDAAKRQLDKLGAPKQLPKRKEVVAEIQSLISLKNECYNDYREKSDRLHELMTMQRNYQMAMQPQQPKHGRKHEQEL